MRKGVDRVHARVPSPFDVYAMRWRLSRFAFFGTHLVLTANGYSNQIERFSSFQLDHYRAAISRETMGAVPTQDALHQAEQWNKAFIRAGDSSD